MLEKLKEYPFFVVSTGTMDERDDQPQFSQLSRPNRILFALATAKTPANFWDYATMIVEFKTLDQVAQEKQIPGRGILKLDVQCGEHIVLEGAKSFLNQVDLVVAEPSYIRYDDEAGEWRSPIDGTLLQKEVVFIRQNLLLPETSRKV